MKKTNIHTELKVLEEANYQSLDEKRITIDAWLVNKVAEQDRKIDILNKALSGWIDRVADKMLDNRGKITELQEQIDEMNKHICKHTSWMKTGGTYYCSDCKNSFVPEQGQELEMFAGEKKGLGHICKPLSNLPGQEKLEDRECDCIDSFESATGEDCEHMKKWRKEHIETEV